MRCTAELRLDGPAKRGKCACQHCGHVNRFPRSDAGPPRHRPFAIEYYNSERKAEHSGRFFKRPDEADLAQVAEAEARWSAAEPRFVPEDEILPGDETDRLHRWGYARYRHMFSARQLLGLEASCRLIAGVEDERVRHALATNLSDLLRYQNLLCRHSPMRCFGPGSRQPGRPRRLSPSTTCPPRDYPVSCYRPDLLCARPDDWRFVEVKGPGDALHFRQANWLLHRRDPAWPFEICMPVKGLQEARFAADEIGPGPAFAVACAEKLEEHQDFLTGISMFGLTGKDLVAAEDRNAASIVRDRRRLWAGLVAKGHDPRSLTTLRSGRLMTVLDSHWPPELTGADMERMAQRAAKQAKNKKRIAAHNRQSARASRRK
ncbi:hypothetical protein JYK14_07790 [Siccirubricoccus sp. KC 17139]|uniref:YqaJ viral recombinase domain-containing protein n=1 Tax=Siccirubricoccus soli TaxID=2899147 RepID=A0ABT1D2E3_9PROT|nr:hypothetical protein [Siccirubricoccus soli]MCO6416071.1 hypothetical protein [Siccirubricoccus soli]MCP2682203.1 hypothetical protein [Siccirubricoccus soli]